MPWPSIEFPKTIRKTKVKRGNQILSADITAIGKFPVIDQGQAFIAGYSDAEERVIRDDLPLVIFGDHTRCIKFVDFPFILGADGTKVLKPKEDLFDPKFFYYALQSLDIPNRGYNRHFTLLKERHLPHPNMDEQRKIAGVLGVVQRAIEQQERLLALTAELKKALMHKLFTEGLRGETQKQTEIGPVPGNWEVANIGELTTTVYRYPTYYGITYVEAGVPEVRGELLLENGEVEKDMSKFRFITEDTARKFPKVRLEPGDIVMSVRGTMGKIGLVPDELKGAVITANLIRLAPDQSRILPKFFRWALLTPRFIQSLNTASPQTTIKTITAPGLKELRLPLPTTTEQAEIAEAIDAVERKVAFHARKHTALTDLFRTLLQQLMTAQIRVHDLDLPELETFTEG